MTTVTDGLQRTMTRLPEQVRKSLTWDRGMELADHKNVSIRTGLDVYFADPRSPWQRGTNENTNRLLRQYLPKGKSMAHLTQDDLDSGVCRRFFISLSSTPIRASRTKTTTRHQFRGSRQNR